MQQNKMSSTVSTPSDDEIDYNAWYDVRDET